MKIIEDTLWQILHFWKNVFCALNYSYVVPASVTFSDSSWIFYGKGQGYIFTVVYVNVARCIVANGHSYASLTELGDTYKMPMSNIFGSLLCAHHDAVDNTPSIFPNSIFHSRVHLRGYRVHQTWQQSWYRAHDSKCCSFTFYRNLRYKINHSSRWTVRMHKTRALQQWMGFLNVSLNGPYVICTCSLILSMDTCH